MDLAARLRPRLMPAPRPAHPASDGWHLLKHGGKALVRAGRVLKLRDRDNISTGELAVITGANQHTCTRFARTIGARQGERGYYLLTLADLESWHYRYAVARAGGATRAGRRYSDEELVAAGGAERLAEIGAALARGARALSVVRWRAARRDQPSR